MFRYPRTKLKINWINYTGLADNSGSASHLFATLAEGNRYRREPDWTSLVQDRMVRRCIFRISINNWTAQKVSLPVIWGQEKVMNGTSERESVKYCPRKIQSSLCRCSDVINTATLCHLYCSMDRKTNVNSEIVPEPNYIPWHENVVWVEVYLHTLLIREYMGLKDHVHIPKASPRQKCTQTSDRSLGGR
jgi:hypothetical protein